MQGFPDGFIDCIVGGSPVFAGDAGGEVGFVEGGGGGATGDVA